MAIHSKTAICQCPVLSTEPLTPTVATGRILSAHISSVALRRNNHGRWIPHLFWLDRNGGCCFHAHLPSNLPSTLFSAPRKLRLIDWGLAEFYHPGREYNVRARPLRAETSSVQPREHCTNRNWSCTGAEPVDRAGR